LLATHGWLNQVASIGPVSSATLASTRFWRRLRIGLTATLRTTAATAARSPVRSSAILRPSRSTCSRGKCSIRSPTVSMPSVSRALPALPDSATSSSSRLGRGSDRGSPPASSSGVSSSLLANVVGIRRI
jgi:hypothetical protein